MAGFFSRERQLVVSDEATGAWGWSVRVDERYRPLVERLDLSARRDPAGYRRRVVLAAMLGYAVIVGLILLCAAVVASLLYMIIVVGEANFLFVKLLAVVAVIGWAVIRSLWVSSEPPQGRPLGAEEAPKLFALIDHLRSKVGGPRIHSVLVTSDLNAAIVQQPRLGLLGWYQNYLIVGLPLLRALSEAEAAAVIAHEIGHFAGQHGRLSSLVYRVRIVWAQLSERLQEGHSANLLRRFFAWYGPWFTAYSFVLARSHEYEADRTAADATSPDTIGAALVRLTVQSDCLDAGWNRFCDEAVETSASDRRPFAEQADWLRNGDDEAARRSLCRGLAQRTGLEDTHPSLTDRLASLGVDPQLPLRPVRTAAAALLGRTADTIAEEFDRIWWADAQAWLDEARTERQRNLEELAGLRDLSQTSLTLDQRHRQAELVSTLESEAASLPLYDSIAADYPEDEAAAWFAALYRLRSGDAAGLAMIEAAAGSPHLAAAACEAVLAFHEARGDEEAATKARARLERALGALMEAESEFRTLRPHTVIEPPDLDEEERAEFRRSVDGIPGLRAVHVGWRHLSEGLGRQQVLLVKVRGMGADPQEVLSSVGELLLPWGDYIGFTVAADTRWLDRRLRAIEGTRLYP